MPRPPVYMSDEDGAVSRNPKADEISADLRRRTIERIDANSTQRVNDPLETLIEGARASS